MQALLLCLPTNHNLANHREGPRRGTEYFEAIDQPNPRKMVQNVPMQVLSSSTNIGLEYLRARLFSNPQSH
jgi:hypothetical protein